jgi:hypothetical protein
LYWFNWVVYLTVFLLVGCFFPTGSHRVEPIGESGCGFNLELQELSRWC